MHDVSNAINILDPSRTIDTKICKDSTGSSLTDITRAGEGANVDDSGSKDCAAKSGITAKGLAKIVGAENIITGFSDTDKMSVVPKTTARISKDVSALNRDQKGVVSSAFAKAHEGAEIVEIRSISTTSVMVNATLTTTHSSHKMPPVH